MKKCPNCEQMFSDDITYCLNDGTVLQAETVPASASLASAEMETQFFPRPPVPASPKADPSKWLYLIIGLMAAVIVALGAAFYYSRSTDQGRKQVMEKGEEPANMLSAANENTVKKSNMVSAPTVFPGGKWGGDFLYPAGSKYSGTAYSVQMDLVYNGGGQVRGRLIWTLLRTNNPEKMKGSTEYIKGTFDKTTRALFINGYDTDDPHDSKIVTRYDLVLSEDEQFLRGTVKGEKTPWKFSLKRVSE